MKILYILALTFFANAFSIGQTKSLSPLLINEIMADNGASYSDAQGDFDDWIEIYNPNDVAVNLSNYYITDDSTLPTKFQFANNDSLVIPANGFLVIWADNETVNGVLHTNFRLGASGEYVGLSNANSELVDSISFPAQTADVSYGRSYDGSSTWINFTTSTPNATNVGNSISGISKNNLGFTVYPNPTKDVLFFNSKIEKFEILDVVGNVVIKGNNAVKIDVSQLKNGIYFIRVNKTLKKFIKN